MTMRHFLGRVIRVHWRKGVCAGLAAVALAATDPLADLKSGVEAVQAKRYPAAIATLQPLARRIPQLADYVAWFVGTADFESQDYAAVPKALAPVWMQTPPSPLSARAALLAAKAYGQTGQPAEALAVLRKNYAALAQPEGDFAMATAFAATGDAVNAAIYYQRVYYGFPLSMEAAQAQVDDAAAPPTASQMLGRAQKLIDSGNIPRARKELDLIIPRLTGADRDVARVTLGVADYEAKDTLKAQQYLKSLEVSAPEADAERINYLLLCARRLKNLDEVRGDLDQLARLYPNSKWRLEALMAAANHYLTENQIDAYEPLYRACYEAFPRDPRAAGCHWRVVWGHYLRRGADAADLLRAHLRLFPASEQASAAMYFLGRLAEASGDSSAARGYYSEITREYPNYFYTVLARDRLAQLGAGAPAPAVTGFLRSVNFPERMRKMNFLPNATAKARLERARMLVTAGLDDWALIELRFGAQTEDQPHVLATELALLSSRNAGPDQAVRYIKRYASGYLFLPIESAPVDFWKFAFPIPFRTELERYSKQNGLDPFLMAALIRQESEFNPKVISRANARGLTQLLPSTGRELSRRLKLKPYTTASLFQPSVNLQLGSFYLKSMTDTLGGREEVALAAYNAGLTRARDWLSWGDFKEPAEFIETVPFTETRNYIQTVLRNADVYRRLYGVTQ